MSLVEKGNMAKMQSLAGGGSPVRRSSACPKGYDLDAKLMKLNEERIKRHADVDRKALRDRQALERRLEEERIEMEKQLERKIIDAESDAAEAALVAEMGKARLVEEEKNDNCDASEPSSMLDLLNEWKQEAVGKQLFTLGSGRHVESRLSGGKRHRKHSALKGANNRKHGSQLTPGTHAGCSGTYPCHTSSNDSNKVTGSPCDTASLFLDPSTSPQVNQKDERCSPCHIRSRCGQTACKSIDLEDGLYHCECDYDLYFHEPQIAYLCRKNNDDAISDRTKDIRALYEKEILAGSLKIASEVRDKLISRVASSVELCYRTCAKKMEIFADACYDRGEYTDAVLFFQVAEHFFEKITDGLVCANSVVYCCAGLTKTARTLIERKREDVIVRQILALIDEIRAKIAKLDKIEHRLNVTHQAWCICCYAIVQAELGDVHSSELTCRRGLDLLEDQLPSTCSEHHVYGRLLDFLGNVNYKKSRFDDASRFISRALVVYENAHDVDETARKDATENAQSTMKEVYYEKLMVMVRS